MQYNSQMVQKKGVMWMNGWVGGQQIKKQMEQNGTWVKDVWVFLELFYIFEIIFK